MIEPWETCSDFWGPELEEHYQIGVKTWDSFGLWNWPDYPLCQKMIECLKQLRPPLLIYWNIWLHKPSEEGTPETPLCNPEWPYKEPNYLKLHFVKLLKKSAASPPTQPKRVNGPLHCKKDLDFHFADWLTLALSPPSGINSLGAQKVLSRWARTTVRRNGPSICQMPTFTPEIFWMHLFRSTRISLPQKRETL